MSPLKKQNLLLIVLIIFYSVGLIGLHTDYRTYFLNLTPFNLLLSFGCLYLSFKDYSLKKHVDILLIAAVGYSLEWIGVHTSVLFGHYHYGSVLGYQWDGIPLTIALNWVLLTFTSTAIVYKWKLPLVLKALIAGALMTGLDWILEPVAIRSGFWFWETNEIPLYNYVCWMSFSSVFAFWVLNRKTVETNKVTVGLFVILVIFFAILNR
ncbi:carotenoid biosynthesis protein [Fluviicola chungangensis]|uniref:Carotenoid biosynthesis protein n=1 Tax=Fluviicola chungangensis TaxID=2597671 RepID=A0A556MNX2_9FLAO|nr:carotenoid biosynthesis protein [Fluviicola chungangensis]TSJ41555.1 carotenoid biosynthesis protein [Fluviicola chungangensis]